MISIREDRAAAAEDAIHGPGQPHRQPLAAACQSLRTLRLDQEMQVIVLDREMKDPEVGARDGDEGAAHGGEYLSAAERGEPGCGAQRDVNWKPWIVRRTASMWDVATASRRRRAAGA